MSHRKIRAAVRDVMAQKSWKPKRPARKITRRMTASGKGVIAFKVPKASHRGGAAQARKRGY